MFIDLFQEIRIADVCQRSRIFLDLDKLVHQRLSGRTDICSCRDRSVQVIDQVNAVPRLIVQEFAAASAVILQIGCIFREMLEGIARLRHQFFNGALPAALIVKRIRIPRVIGNTVQRYFGSVSLLHRIREESGHIVKIRVQVVERSHQKLAVAVVIYRIVPPYCEISVHAGP